MGLWEWVIRRTFRPSLPPVEPGTLRLHPEVNSEEFSRVMAKALVDKQGRQVLVPLFQASEGWVTPREMAILKYAVGEEDRDFLLRVIAEKKTVREAAIFNHQLTTLRSVFGTEDQPPTQAQGPPS